jgi:hypothetical protein
MERFALPLALCLILIGAARIATTWRSLSLTTDEPYHFTCGLDYLATGRVCAPENPPLQPLASALLPFLDGIRPDPVINARWTKREDIGREQMQALLLRAPDPWRIIVRMRAGVLPFFIAAALVVFFAARHWLGSLTALVSTALFTLTPAVLAHSALATTDISAAATLGAAFFLLVRWCAAPSWRNTVWLGIALGLAVFSKFSTLGFLAGATVLSLAFHILVSRPAMADLIRLARQRVPGLLAAGGVAALVVWAGCLFSFGRVEGWPAWLRLPAPELFGAFRELAAHVRRGHPAYLLGEVGFQGWWYYYPVALAVKTPIALMLAAVAGLWSCWEQRRRGGLLFVAFCLGILIVAAPSRINLGIRHILPFFVGLSVIAGVGLVRLARISMVLPAALVLWLAVSGARAHPDYLSYFNGFTGDRSEDFLIDSDLEWDQSWVRVGRFLRSRGASEVTLQLLHGDFASAEILERVYGLPPARRAPQVSDPTPGWHVVNAPTLRVIAASNGRADRNIVNELVTFKGPTFRIATPVQRIGGLVLLQVPPNR